MVFIQRKAHFNAAHRLHNPQKSDEWNEKTYGKCNSENWHGHNYVIRVTVAGKPDGDTGYVIDLNTLSDIIEERIIAKCDHKNLNLDVAFLQGTIPSTENLVKEFYERLAAPINDITNESSFLYSVRLRETERNFAEYCPHILLKNTPVKD